MKKLPESLMPLLTDWINLMYIKLIVNNPTEQEKYLYSRSTGNQILDVRYSNRMFIEYYTCVVHRDDYKHVSFILGVFRDKKCPFPQRISDEWVFLDKGSKKKIDVNLPIRIRMNSIIKENLIFIEELKRDLKLKMIEFI